ncbi:hypothetical protein [Pseudodesulfovibrio karagichevae]|uniref:Lipoprotein n=1 Tax=Pseudodesulfovibrio karagichevae TaxID=3239305 RepID=A0ABV4K060_9BACT
MKRILFLILAASLLFACAPKQPKTMEQQAEEARAEAYKKSDEKAESGEKQEDPGKPKRERKTSLGDILTIISY